MIVAGVLIGMILEIPSKSDSRIAT